MPLKNIRFNGRDIAKGILNGRHFLKNVEWEPEEVVFLYDTSVQTVSAFFGSREITVNSDTGPDELMLPLDDWNGFNSNNLDLYVDWGDGTQDHFDVAWFDNYNWDAMHVYDEPGIYAVRMSGTFKLQFGFWQDASKLIDVLQWSNQPVWELDYIFSRCLSLTHISAIDKPFFQGEEFPSYFFDECTIQTINGVNDWDMSQFKKLEYVFEGSHFNDYINDWDVSNVESMLGMFRICEFFNQPLDKWDVSNVTNFSYMFQGVTSWSQTVTNQFNQPLNTWDVSRATTFLQMFENSLFNSSVSGWHIKASANTNNMFRNSIFNQPINWTFENYFLSRTTIFEAWDFNQDISNLPLVDFGNNTSWVTTSMSKLNLELALDKMAIEHSLGHSMLTNRVFVTNEQLTNLSSINYFKTNLNWSFRTPKINFDANEYYCIGASSGAGFFLENDGTLISFGSGNSFWAPTLGVNAPTSSSNYSFQNVTTHNNIYFKKFWFGHHKVLAISNDNKIFIWGRSFRIDGILSHYSIPHEITNLGVLSTMNPNDIVEVSMSIGEACFILMSSGEVVAFGQSEVFNVLHGNVRLDFPSILNISLPPEDGVKHIRHLNLSSSRFYDALYFTTNQGKVFFLGTDAFGVGTIGYSTGSVTTFDREIPQTEITHKFGLNPNETIEKITTQEASNNRHTYFLTSQNRLLFTGQVLWGNHAPTSSGGMPAGVHVLETDIVDITPNLQHLLDQNEVIVDVRMGQETNYVRTNLGKIIGWGRSGFDTSARRWILNTFSTNSYAVPRIIYSLSSPIPHNYDVEKTWSANRGGGVLTPENKLFVWGNAQEFKRDGVTNNTQLVHQYTLFNY